MMYEPVVEMRRCSKCGTEYPATDKFFYRQEKWLRTDCKICARRKVKDAYASNPGPVKERVRRWRRENPELAKEQSRQEYLKDPIKNNARASRWRREHPTESRQAEYAWRRENPERTRQHKQRWYRDNREKARVSTSRRESIRLNLPVNFTDEDWLICIEYWQNQCAYCGVTLSARGKNRTTIEHFVSISSPDCPGTVVDNILPACHSCNSSKKDRRVDEWLTRRHGEGKTKEILSHIEKYFNWRRERSG